MIDGEIVTLETAAISVHDRGFLYGDGVFETMRAHGPPVFALDEHLARLERSARAIDLPIASISGLLRDEVREARAASPLVDAAVRLIVTRGAAPPGTMPAEPTRVVLVDPLPAPPVGPVRAITSPWWAPAIPGAKLTSYAPNLLASSRARAGGADEALLVDADGRIREGATSNVMVVDGGTLVTAPASDGILEGVTRGLVLDLAREMGLAVRLESPAVAFAKGASEVILTSTFREVLPVCAVDGHPIGTGRYPVAEALLAALRRSAGA